MYKWFAFFILCMTFTLNAEECGCRLLGIDLEVRGAYFYPSSTLVREIYPDARFDVEIEISKTLCGNWSLWSNFTYFDKNGRSTGLDERTNLKLFPLSLGVKYCYPYSCFSSLYAGFGINYTWMRLFNDSDIVPRHVHKACLGATIKTGWTYAFTEHFFTDAFIDYLYIPMHLSNVYNLGGFRFGLGIGTHF